VLATLQSAFLQANLSNTWVTFSKCQR